MKCNWIKKSVKFLGHMISKNTIRPLNDRLIAIKEYPVPKSKKQVRQFLGKVNYNYKFIENCSIKLAPFT